MQPFLAWSIKTFFVLSCPADQKFDTQGNQKPRIKDGSGFPGVKRVNIQEEDRACDIPVNIQAYSTVV